MSRQTFLATTDHGLARAWQHASGEWQVDCFLAGQDVRCLAAHRTRPDVVYAGTQGNGVLRSNDGGSTWSAAGLEGQVVKALATSPTLPDTVYAGTRPARLFVSHDAGVQWAELTSFRRIPGHWFWFSPAEQPYRAYVQAIALSPTDQETILVGIEAGAVVRSRDGGQTWTGHRRGALRDCHALTFHATHGDWVYEGGGTGAGVSVSRDAGATWRQPREGLDRHYGWAVAADPAEPDVWYASVAPGARSAHSENQAQAAIVRSIGGCAGYLGHPFRKSETWICMFLYFSHRHKEKHLYYISTKGMFRTAKPTLNEQASRSLSVGKRKMYHLCSSKEN